MKKNIPVFLSLTLAVSLVLLNFSPVRAFDWQAPVVTPGSGDKEFTAAVTAPAALPGTVTGDNAILFPAGFPAGTAQFGGDGVVVKGFTGGTASACFSIPPARSEWVGSIHQWNGTKWIKLPTTITEGDVESNSASACASIYGDGTFALIMGYTGAPEPKGLPVCSADMRINGYSYATVMPLNEMNPLDSYLIQILDLNINLQIAPGTVVSYSLLNINPTGSMAGTLTRGGTVIGDSGYGTEIRFVDLIDLDPPFDPSAWIISNDQLSRMNFTLRLTFPNCYKDFSNPFSSLR